MQSIEAGVVMEENLHSKRAGDASGKTEDALAVASLSSSRSNVGQLAKRARDPGKGLRYPRLIDSGGAVWFERNLFAGRTGFEDRGLPDLHRQNRTDEKVPRVGPNGAGGQGAD